MAYITISYLTLYSILFQFFCCYVDINICIHIVFYFRHVHNNYSEADITNILLYIILPIVVYMTIKQLLDSNSKDVNNC